MSASSGMRYDNGRMSTPDQNKKPVPEYVDAFNRGDLARLRAVRRGCRDPGRDG